jgi:hypothetical protein
VEVKWCAAGNLKKSNGVFNFTFVGIIDRHWVSRNGTSNEMR